MSESDWLLDESTIESSGVAELKLLWKLLWLLSLYKKASVKSLNTSSKEAYPNCFTGAAGAGSSML